jgi:retron-type reverse transcriptase
MIMRMVVHEYKDIISIENLLEAWNEFLRGKKNKKDVQEFERNLMSNVITLYQELKNKTYRHGPYQHFKISDPKSRDIHKATVRDRLVHHATYRVLYPYFDTKFIYDSYSCRLGKGTHRANARLRDFVQKVSKNNTKQCFVLKCDIKKFFASIDQSVLISILQKYIQDRYTLNLLQNIIESFDSGKASVGLPLGNLTSQLLVNIYMNEFDQWMKHQMKIKYYIRYADDFVIVHENKEYIINLILNINDFLQMRLKLSLHPNKVFITTIYSGIDFLGWVHFPYHKTIRTVTQRRMFKRLEENRYKDESVQSYIGLLGHGDCFGLIQKIKSSEEFIKNYSN